MSKNNAYGDTLGECNTLIGGNQDYVLIQINIEISIKSPQNWGIWFLQPALCDVNVALVEKRKPDDRRWSLHNMTSQKVGASQHNARAASFENAVTVSKTPQTPHGGGGGYTNIEITNDISIDNHQSINHNHCPLDDCDPYTEHRFPDAIGEHIEFHFLFQGKESAVKRYGPDILNKTIALMRVKIVEEDFFPKVLGAYFRSKCEEFLKGSNVPTGVDQSIRVNALQEHAKRARKPKSKADLEREKWQRETARAAGRRA